MKTWADFLAKVRLDVAGCPEPVMELAAKLTAIDFFRTSFTWRVENVTLPTTVANQRDYTVTTNPSNAALVAICSAWDGLDEVDVEIPGEADDVAYADSAANWTVGVKNSTTVRISPAPSVAGVVLKATCAYAPTEAATGIDDELYYQFRDAIELGAIGRLKLQAGKQWGDLVLGPGFSEAYEAKKLDYSSRSGPVRRRRIRVAQWG